ncbi:hypothetical protein KI387_028350, partial [Taxus chinensis]
MKHIILGDSGKEEDLILELFSEPNSKARLDLEEIEEVDMGHSWKEKEKGKMVYMIDDEEVDNLDVIYIKGARKVMDSTDEKT